MELGGGCRFTVADIWLYTGAHGSVRDSLMVEAGDIPAIIANVENNLWTGIDTECDSWNEPILPAEPVADTPIYTDELRIPQETVEFWIKCVKTLRIGKPWKFCGRQERVTCARTTFLCGTKNSGTGWYPTKYAPPCAPHTHRGPPRDNAHVLNVAQNSLLAHAHGGREALPPILPHLGEGAR